MSSLYELSSAMQAVEFQLMESDGETSEALEAYIESLDIRVSDKVENYCQLIRNQEAFAKSIGDEIKRMQGRKATIDRSVGSLKARLFEALQRMDVSKVKTERFTVGIQKAGGVQPLVVDDVERLPERYQKKTITADNSAIREALKAGEPLYGVRLEEQKTVLRIR